MPGKTLVVLGSGPGIGVAIAKTFSVRGFTHIALVSRNEERLRKDEDAVLDAVQGSYVRFEKCFIRSMPLECEGYIDAIPGYLPDPH